MSRSETNPEKSRRHFDDQFKEQAVTLWLSSGKPAKTIAQELGVDNPNLLYQWRKTFAPDRSPPGAKASTEDLSAENAALRRELDRVRQQRDILKKTLGILSEAPGSATNGSRP